MTTVASALADARQLGLARLDAQLLLAQALGCSRTWLLAHDEQNVPDLAATAYRTQCLARADEVPLSYLLGTREFHGLLLDITPHVLDPRPDTETLVDWALHLLGNMPGNPSVLDLGTGSGAIALALANGCPAAHVTGSDVSNKALEVARRTGQRLALPVRWMQGSWWDAVQGQRFDMVVSNPPYLCETDHHLHALRHEPRTALVSGADGLEAYRAIIACAGQHLQPGGWLLFEHGASQAAKVAEMLQMAGFQGVSTQADLAGLPRCTGARWI